MFTTQSQYFVLQPRGSSLHAQASCGALRAYAFIVSKTHRDYGEMLLSWTNDCVSYNARLREQHNALDNINNELNAKLRSQERMDSLELMQNIEEQTRNLAKKFNLED